LRPEAAVPLAPKTVVSRYIRSVRKAAFPLVCLTTVFSGQVLRFLCVNYLALQKDVGDRRPEGLQMRVLLIEDEQTTANAIELILRASGINVYKTDLGEEGFDLAKLYDYDIILLDLNLPDMHGYDVLKKLRMARVATPVLILSGINEMDSKVRSFGFGADDYVTKPFHREELIARIQAVVRRSKGHSHAIIRTGKLAVNLDTKTVEVDDARVYLTGKEYAMLELMSLRKGTTLTKEMFLNHLYGGMDEPEVKIIDVFICKLRKKLSLACQSNDFIETVWGRGYMLRDPVKETEKLVA
jgi:two-component system cell cycle response regulator CtrA